MIRVRDSLNELCNMVRITLDTLAYSALTVNVKPSPDTNRTIPSGGVGMSLSSCLMCCCFAFLHVVVGTHVLCSQGTTGVMLLPTQNNKLMNNYEQMSNVCCCCCPTAIASREDVVCLAMKSGSRRFDVCYCTFKGARGHVSKIEIFYYCCCLAASSAISC